MPQAPAPTAPRAARPVAGGEIQVQSSRGDLETDSTIVYEVWAAPGATGSVTDGWVELSMGPGGETVRLGPNVLDALKLATDTHFGEAEVREVGIGMSDDGLSVALRQEWSAGLVLGTLLLIGVLIGALTATMRSRRREVAFRTIARHEIASREAERSRVAREIHDGPLQEIAALARSAAESTKAQHSLREVATELRALAAGLRPPALDRFGLMPALEDLAERYARAARPLSVRLMSDEPETAPERLESDTELALYRVAQEALANAVTHGRAQTAWVFLRRVSGDLELVIRDDGRGLTPGIGVDRAGAQALVASGHFGLAGMRERAHAVGGGLTVAPGPGDLGTEVRLRIPMVSQ